MTATPTRHRIITPGGLPAPRGYSNGIVATGPVLYVAGQIGWEPDGTFASDELAPQLGRALDHVLAIVEAAGGVATDIVRMTIYVTDLPAYRSSLPAIGAVWRQRMGRHYPAMALLGVAGLVEPRAKVEIEATCVLPDGGAS